MRIGKLAPWYRWIEYAAFGRALERRRFAFLEKLAGATRVLILGEGDGRVLQRLLAIAPEARIDVFDVSPEMIALARARNGDRENVSFYCEDVRASTIGEGYDAVITLFFLDCFTEADAGRLIPRMASAMKPGGLWLVSDFAIPRHGWRKNEAKIWIRTMYLFFRIATGLEPQSLPPIEPLLNAAGLVCSEREEERGGMIYTAVFRRQS